MKRIPAVLGYLFCSFLLSAQSGSFGPAGSSTSSVQRNSSQGAVLVLESQATVSSCPIGMHARQGVWDHTIRIRNEEDKMVLQPFGQRFFLTLKDAHPSRIVSATLRVHGLMPRSRAIPTAGATSFKAEATKVINARFTAEDGAVLADVYVPGFTSVSSVELQEVTYADGSTWKISASSVCRTTPDPFMLIAEH